MASATGDVQDGSVTTNSNSSLKNVDKTDIKSVICNKLDKLVPDKVDQELMIALAKNQRWETLKSYFGKLKLNHNIYVELESMLLYLADNSSNNNSNNNNNINDCESGAILAMLQISNYAPFSPFSNSDTLFVDIDTNTNKQISPISLNNNNNNIIDDDSKSDENKNDENKNDEKYNQVKRSVGSLLTPQVLTYGKDLFIRFQSVMFSNYNKSVHGDMWHGRKGGLKASIATDSTDSASVTTMSTSDTGTKLYDDWYISKDQIGVVTAMLGTTSSSSAGSFTFTRLSSGGSEPYYYFVISGQTSSGSTRYIDARSAASNQCQCIRSSTSSYSGTRFTLVPAPGENRTYIFSNHLGGWVKWSRSNPPKLKGRGEQDLRASFEYDDSVE